jgi:gas vesicle protein
MRKAVRKEFVLAVAGCLVAVLIAGCEEQDLSTTKKSRLLTYENRKLKEQLAQQERKIEEQSRLLEKCQQEKDVLEKRFKEEVNASMGKMMEIFTQADEELRQEKKQLEARVEELQAQLRELEQELEKSGSSGP